LSIESGKSSEAVGTLDQLNEVLVVVDVRRHVIVVLSPFLQVDASVFVLQAEALSVMSLEGVKEFAKNVVFRAHSTHHVGVLLSVVNTLDVAQVNRSIELLVKFVKRHLDDGLTLGIHLTNYSSDKLVEVELLIAISVADFENSLDFFVAARNVIVVHRSLDLVVIKLAISVFVHDSEGSGHATDAAGASCNDLVGNALANFLRRFID